MSNFRAILIAGPTASGKSQLAIEIAERIDGVIVNADSMQVYEDLHVLTARPSNSDMALVTHALYGFVPGSTAYSAGRYALDAERVISECLEAGKMPILVGGTGLYFRALLDGLSPIPQIPRTIRQHWRSEADRMGPVRLHHILTTRDGEMAARLEATDTQRIVRALEVLDATGQSLADWQRIPGVPVLPTNDTIKIVIDTDREDSLPQKQRTLRQHARLRRPRRGAAARGEGIGTVTANYAGAGGAAAARPPQGADRSGDGG